MAYIVLALGALLSIGGALSIYTGAGIVEVERGWTGVIAGATALSGGIVTIALGLVLKALVDLRATLAAQGIQPTTLPVTVDVQHDFEPHHPVEPAPPQAAAAASLFTPELESSLLAAMTASHEPAHEPEHGGATAAPHGHHDGDLAAIGPVDTMEILPPEPPAPETAAERHDSHDAPGSTMDHPEDTPPVEPVAETRPRLTLRGRPVPEPQPAPAAAVPDDQTIIEEPVHEQIEPAASHSTAIEPPSMETPGTDDWLDRAFSAIDNEGFRHDAHPAETSGTHPLPAEEHVVPPSEGSHAEGEPYPAAESVSHDVAHAEPQTAIHVPEPAHPAANPEAPAVIGRYEADGTSYVMYADGSIEAHSETGVERFASMAELKAFIEAAV